MRDLMMEEKHRLRGLIRKLKESFQYLPEGTIYTVKNRGRNRLFYYLDGKSIYIKKDDIEFAAALAERKYNEFLLEEAQYKLAAAEAYLNVEPEMDRREFFEKNPEILRLLPGRYDHSREEMIPDIEEKVRQWVAADYKKLERSYTGTLYKTMRGEFVKSVA